MDEVGVRNCVSVEEKVCEQDPGGEEYKRDRIFLIRRVCELEIRGKHNKKEEEEGQEEKDGEEE